LDAGLFWRTTNFFNGHQTGQIFWLQCSQTAFLIWITDIRITDHTISNFLDAMGRPQNPK